MSENTSSTPEPQAPQGQPSQPAAPGEPQSPPPELPPPPYEQDQPYQQAQEQPYQQGYQQGYQQPYAAAGPAPLSPTDERNWSIAAHLSPFLASFVGLPFLGPLVIYLVFRDRGPFIRHHAAQALNFQIIVAIGLLISVPLMFVLVGFVTAAIIAVAAIVFQIVAAVEANNGKWYRYPLTPDWVK
jgi:uncharacterized Tic20 family protein